MFDETRFEQFLSDPTTWCVVSGTGFPSVHRDAEVSKLIAGSGVPLDGLDVGKLVEGTIGMKNVPGTSSFGAIGSGSAAATAKHSKTATAHSLGATFNRSGAGGGLGGETKRKSAAGGGSKGGAGGGDAYTEYVHKSRREAGKYLRT